MKPAQCCIFRCRQPIAITVKDRNLCDFHYGIYCESTEWPDINTWIKQFNNRRRNNESKRIFYKR